MTQPFSPMSECHSPSSAWELRHATKREGCVLEIRAGLLLVLLVGSGLLSSQRDAEENLIFRALSITPLSFIFSASFAPIPFANAECLLALSLRPL